MRGGRFREVVARGDLTVLQLPVNRRMAGSFYVSVKLPTYPSPKPTLTLSSHLELIVGLGRGRWAVSEKRKMIQMAHIGWHCTWIKFMIVDTFRSLNESYLLFRIPMWFLMVHFICGFSLSTNKWLSFFTTGDWYDRSNICSHFQGIAWQVTFRQPFSIIRVLLHFTK